MDENERIETCGDTTEKGNAKVDFFVHENDMMLKDVDNERLHETHRKTIFTICLTFVLIIIVFVAAYTVRTSVWLNTINRMNDSIIQMAELHHHCGAEVEDGQNTNHSSP